MMDAGRDAGGDERDAAVESDAGIEPPLDCQLEEDFVLAPEEGRYLEAAAAAVGREFVVAYGIREGDRDSLRAARITGCGGLLAEAVPIDETGAFIAGGQVAGLPDGGFAVGWAKVDGDATDDGAVLQTYDSEGRPRSAVTTANETEIDSQFVTSAVALPQGVAFAWVDWSAASFNQRPDVRFRIFDADAVPLTSEELLTRGPDGRQDLPVLGASPDGSLLASYHESGLLPWARRRNAEGRWLDVVPIAVSAERKQVTSIASDGERYGLAIVSRATEEGGDVELALLDTETGELEVVPLSAAAGIDEEDGRVVALPEGGWLVAWTDRSLVEDDSGRGVLAQRLFADGVPDGDRFLVPTATLSDQVLQAVAAGPGGVLVVWIDRSQADGRRGSALRARLLPHVVVEEAQ